MADELLFTKFEGAGNDYLLVDGIAHPFPEESGPELARAMSQRRAGVGADGLIVLAPDAPVRDHQLGVVGRMWMWNADGSRGAMCGNGLRLLGRFAREQGHASGDRMAIATDVGVRRIELIRDLRQRIVGARVLFPPVEVSSEPLPLTGYPGFPPGTALIPASVGNPHGVVFVADAPEGFPLAALGMGLQRHPRFPDGVNVELVQVVDGVLRQRTWERGSGETMSCGSGALAAVAVARAQGFVTARRVDVELLGGRLVVECQATPAEAQGTSAPPPTGDGWLVLEGPARSVCRGCWPLDTPPPAGTP